MNWNPIETAPRDGTEVLVWDGTDKIVVFYSDMYNCFMDRHGWVHESDIWHPLPDPPTVSQPLTVPPVVKNSLTPALPMDEDLDEPLGPACSRDNPECESCQ